MKAWKVRSGGKGKDVSDAFWGKKVAAIGWGLGDLSRVSNREEIKDKLRVEYPGRGESSLGNVAGSIHRFVNEIEVGDLILTPPTENRDFLIGQCQSHYKYLPKLLPKGYEDVREVNWLKRIPRSALSAGLRSSCSGEITVSDISKHIEEIETLLGEATNIPNEARWDEFVRFAQAYVDTGRLEWEEIEYKVETGLKLAEAREAVLSGGGDWASLVKGGIASNTIFNVLQLRFRTWIDDSPEDALVALKAIWTRDDLPLAHRIRSFNDLLPVSGTSREGHPIGLSGVGTRMNVMSVLLMGLDADQYPPFRVGYFGEAYERTAYDLPEQGADEAALYEHALGFLDRFIEEAEKRGLTLRHRLEAQSVVWAIKDSTDEVPEDIPEMEDQPQPPDLEGLAARVYLPVDFLEEIQTLLKDKKQVIFQGPPGTGKTYVAQALAKHLAGLEDRVTLVQFHPSYAYEDFVQGFRPAILKGGQPGFELRDGPLLQIAKRADTDKDNDYYLIIDEINRGSVAKVFGELYFLLEYRGERIRLQYQRDDEDDFLLPSNLYIIGTMNTADRSIALVDLALRRRFYFVEFHPDEEPVKDVLRRWLKGKGLDHMAWVADVVDRANEKLKDDRHAAIGPSYFMKPSLDDEAVRRIWKHSVLPYIEERRFGGEQATDEFELDKLRRASASGSAGADNGEGNGPHPLPEGEGT